MARLIANMVGRNEADKYLVEVLDRLKEQVDHIVFTDDASDDDTIEVVSRYTDLINPLEEPLFAVHEGKLRQKSWDFLNKKLNPDQNDWILAIDCDELLYETDNTIRDLMKGPHDVVNIMFYHMWNENQFRIDKAWNPNSSHRLFRFRPGGSFANLALACGSEPTFVRFTTDHYPGRYMAHSGLKMKHLSYIKDEDKLDKYKRYSSIDGGKFHAGAHIQSIMDPIDEVVLRDWIW